jgi:hypothetical protein
MESIIVALTAGQILEKKETVSSTDIHLKIKCDLGIVVPPEEIEPILEKMLDASWLEVHTCREGDLTIYKRFFPPQILKQEAKRYGRQSNGIGKTTSTT